VLRRGTTSAFVRTSIIMDAVVQFIRNALCCIKDLNLFRASLPAIYDPMYTALFFDFPEPLNKTTPLELVISTTQLYACVSTTKSGFQLVTTSIGKLKRITRLVESRQLSSKKLEDKIINESLLKEAKFAIRSIFVGTLVTPIGICFWWLFINSFHITEVDWFGGLPALIHALEVMEICLLPLLYFMIMDGLEMLRKAAKAKDLLKTVEDGTLAGDQFTTQTYEAMTGWVPFWDSGVGLFEAPVDSTTEEKLMADETKKVQAKLASLLPSPGRKTRSASSKDDGLRKEALEEVADKLRGDVPVWRMEGFREFAYFVFNFIAFYGYLMAPLTFYFQDDSQPEYIRSLKFAYNNTDADWYGNFAGDLMWTIEPVVILGSPALASWIRPPKKKVKSD
jgi:hypothetical protein